jgi:hypothetical protein
MTTRSDELFYVEQFLARMPNLQLVAQRDKPDFIVSDAEGEFGLELTRVFRNGPRPESSLESQETESLRRRLLRDTAEYYYRNGGLPLRVGAIIRVHDLDPAMLSLRLRAERPAEEGGESSFEMFSENDPRTLPQAKFFLRSLPPECGRYAAWRVVNNSVGWHRQLTARDLEPKIARKAKRLVEYRKARPRVALLLCVDATVESGMLDWSPEHGLPSPHGFDAVYLYLHGYDTVLRLA